MLFSAKYTHTHTHRENISQINSMDTKQGLLQNLLSAFVLGLDDKVLLVRGLQKWPLWEEAAPMLDRASSKKDLLLVKVEPIRNNGGALVITYLRKSKKMLQSNCDRRSIKICEKHPCKHAGQRRKEERCSRGQSRHFPTAHGESHRETGWLSAAHGELCWSLWMTPYCSKWINPERICNYWMERSTPEGPYPMERTHARAA